MSTVYSTFLKDQPEGGCTEMDRNM